MGIVDVVVVVVVVAAAAAGLAYIAELVGLVERWDGWELDEGPMSLRCLVGLGVGPGRAVKGEVRQQRRRRRHEGRSCLRAGGRAVRLVMSVVGEPMYLPLVADEQATDLVLAAAERAMDLLPAAAEEVVLAVEQAIYWLLAVAEE